MRGADALRLIAAMNLQRIIGLAALLIGSRIAEASSAQPPPAPSALLTPVAMVQSATAVTMDQAVRLAEQHFHARVVKAETEHANGRTVYVLRLLNDAGRVWTVRVDAASGELR